MIFWSYNHLGTSLSKADIPDENVLVTALVCEGPPTVALVILDYYHHLSSPLTWHESLPASPPAQIWPSSRVPMVTAHSAWVTTGTLTSDYYDD